MTDDATTALALSRRGMLSLVGLAPAAMVLTPGLAWSIDSRVSITVEGAQRVIRSNGIPDHETGSFPNRRNPNRISEQKNEFRMPAQPRRTGRVTKMERQMFGVAMNGVPFDPFTAEYWQRDRRSGWRYEAMTGKTDLGLDQHNAHVQPNGAYHYHGLPKRLVRAWSPNSHSGLIGYAADGFPIYALYGFQSGRTGDPIVSLRSSWRLKRGQRPTGPGGQFDGTFVEDFEYIPGLGDLDETNGRETQTPEYPNGTYAYFLTDVYPFIPRAFAGQPDPSFNLKPPSGGPRRPGGGPDNGRGGHPPRPGDGRGGFPPPRRS